MNKNELIADVAAKTGMSKQQAAEAVDSVLRSIASGLANGEEVKLPGFGNFSVRERAARSGRNPATGEQIQIPAQKSPKFSPSKTLKMAINGDPTTDP